jgi:hypothetical protein
MGFTKIGEAMDDVDGVEYVFLLEIDRSIKSGFPPSNLKPS